MIKQSSRVFTACLVIGRRQSRYRDPSQCSDTHSAPQVALNSVPPCWGYTVAIAHRPSILRVPCVVMRLGHSFGIEHCLIGLSLLSLIPLASPGRWLPLWWGVSDTNGGRH